MSVEADVEVLKTQIKQISNDFIDHVTQNREDFKEVHSRMTTMQREINQEIFDYWEFYLLPNQEPTITRTLPIPYSVSMVNILPHCHLLGKSWVIYATTLSNEIIPIIRINKWDFDWQSFYYPEYLLKIPAGSTITATCVYDNTSCLSLNSFSLYSWRIGLRNWSIQS